MSPTTVHLVGLGCARNDVDTEELAARFAAAGFTLTEEPADAEVVVVNTCGFIEAAKRDSIDQLLAAADLRGPGRTRQVVATGCLAERYGRDLAASLPEVDAVIGFDGYADIAATVRGLLAGRPAPSHTPGDRRRRSPLAPVARPAAVQLALPGHGTTAVDAASRARSAAAPGRGPASGPPILRRRLSSSPSAPLKIASGCDRRCAFCAIPSFRGAFVSRPPADILAEAAWLGEQGVRELCLVSENTTSYGKDLGGSEPLSRLLRQLGALAAGWVRLSYLQPAELTDALISAIAGTDRVVPYFDVPFQHAARPVLRRMRRFGDAESYLGLIDRIRAAAPGAAIRSNVIVGFPGETPDDLAVLTDFLADADLDAVGVFGYSDEEDTAAAGLDGHLDEAEIAARVEAVADLADILMAERAGRLVGTAATVLVEAAEPDGRWRGRTARQGPESDGETWLEAVAEAGRLAPGDFVEARVTGCDGVDVAAVALGAGRPTP